MLNNFFEWYARGFTIEDFSGISIESIEEMILTFNPNESDAHDMAQEVYDASN